METLIFCVISYMRKTHNKTSEEKEKQIIEAYISNIKGKELEKLFNVNKTTIYSILRRNNIERERFKKKKERTEKICKFCGTLFDLSFFNKSKKGIFSPYCKKCEVLKNKIIRHANPEKMKIKREASRRWKLLNKEKVREMYRNRRKNNIQYRIKSNLRRRLNKYIRNIFNCNRERTIAYLGCSIDYLKSYLEMKFKENMSWDNYGKWEIDHILPCVSFDLTKEENLHKCFHYTNLQPLWKEENMKKGSKIL